MHKHPRGVLEKRIRAPSIRHPICAVARRDRARRRALSRPSRANSRRPRWHSLQSRTRRFHFRPPRAPLRTYRPSDTTHHSPRVTSASPYSASNVSSPRPTRVAHPRGPSDRHELTTDHRARHNYNLFRREKPLEEKHIKRFAFRTAANSCKNSPLPAEYWFMVEHEDATITQTTERLPHQMLTHVLATQTKLKLRDTDFLLRSRGQDTPEQPTWRGATTRKSSSAHALRIRAIR